LQNDIILTTSPDLGQNNINIILNELRGWSDANQNKYQSDCQPNSLDAWVHNVDNCPTDYTKGGSIGSKSCLLLTDFNADSASLRYSTQTGCKISGSTDFNSVAQAVSRYVEELNTYIQSNKDLINELIANNNDINDKFVAIAQRVLDFLDRMSGIINPLVELFEKIVGDSGLFNIVNCGKYMFLI
jgi:hypothetical protein